MTPIERALILCGSPKRDSGTSHAFAAYLARRLEAAGVRTTLRSRFPSNELLADVDAAELLILSFPLYADGIPARLKEALVEIAAADLGPKRCAALVQCGFLESAQNDSAIAMCRLFARDAGFVWLGGLGRGAGGMLGGKELEEAPQPLHATRAALDRTALQLAKGEALSDEIKAVFAAPLIPRWLYARAADSGFLWELFKHGQLFKTFRRPVKPPPER